MSSTRALSLAAMSRLSWRYLWRNYRRTSIMLLAIGVGVWAMIFMTALMRGMVDQMIADGIDALPGLVQVHDPAFQDDPSTTERGKIVPRRTSGNCAKHQRALTGAIKRARYMATMGFVVESYR